MVRYTYGTGYKTRARASEALDDMFADGEVSECERPEIEKYTVILKEGKASRYKITLEG